METVKWSSNVWRQAYSRALPFLGFMAFLLWILALTCFCGIKSTSAGSLADIEHVVLFMQENRAFDHVILPLKYQQCMLMFHSTLGQWPASGDSQIQTSKYQTEEQSGTSKSIVSDLVHDFFFEE